MSLEAAILGFLEERPRSGYDLKTRCFDDDAKPFWTADQAQIYRTLERLQTSRLVASKRTRQVGKPDRRVFGITPLGRTTLASWIADAAPLATPREPFLLQLFFGAELSDAQLIELLKDRRCLHQSRLEEFRRRGVAATTDISIPLRQAALRESAFDGAIAQERAAVDWLDDTIEAVAAGNLPSAETESGSQRHLFGSGTS